jgi:hypothetical protein
MVVLPEIDPLHGGFWQGYTQCGGARKRVVGRWQVARGCNTLRGRSMRASKNA